MNEYVQIIHKYTLSPLPLQETKLHKRSITKSYLIKYFLSLEASPITVEYYFSYFQFYT